MKQMTVFEFIKIANPLLISLPNSTKTMKGVLLSSTTFNTRRDEKEEKKRQQTQQQQREKKKKSSPKQKKHVRFHPIVRFREIQHVCELSRAHQNNLWYTLEDFQTFAKDGYKELLERKYYHQVAVLNNNEDLHDDEMLYHTSLYTKLEEQSQRRILESIWSVRIYQARNKNDGIDVSDPEELAAVYTPHCIQSSQDALLIGMNDARWVQKQEQKRLQQEEYNRMTKTKRSSSSSSSSSLSLSTSQQQQRRRSSYNSRKDYKNQRERYLKAKLPRIPTSTNRRRQHGAVVVTASSTTTRAR